MRSDGKKDLVRYKTTTSPIIHFVCPPKFCISIVFGFSWDDCKSQEKLKTMFMQNFGGQTDLECIMEDVKMVN